MSDNRGWLDRFKAMNDQDREWIRECQVDIYAAETKIKHAKRTIAQKEAAIAKREALLGHE